MDVAVLKGILLLEAFRLGSASKLWEATGEVFGEDGVLGCGALLTDC